jgi:dienelactone hydrolase
MPEHMRRQLRILGVSDEMLSRSLLRMRSLSDWPYVWEAEGDARLAAGERSQAFAAYYAAQRILITPSPLKDRLYALARDAYAHVPQPPLERFDATNERGERIAGYLQLPDGAGPHPAILMLPGVTGTKEELHAYAMPLLRRGWAVARIDHPMFGDTEGVLDNTSIYNGKHTFARLVEDPRIDASRIHIHGMSMGAHFALHTALATSPASVTTICPPFAPGVYARNLPTMNLVALQHMTRLPRVDDLVTFAEGIDLTDRIQDLRAPLRIFHGGRDRTVPMYDVLKLEAGARCPTALTVYERDHHNCLEHLDEITAATLEFLDDPHGVCERLTSIERRDEAASLHVSDREALYAEAGRAPAATIGAIPLLLRGRRLETQLTAAARRLAITTRSAVSRARGAQ